METIQHLRFLVQIGTHTTCYVLKIGCVVVFVVAVVAIGVIIFLVVVVFVFVVVIVFLAVGTIDLLTFG